MTIDEHTRAIVGDLVLQIAQLAALNDRLSAVLTPKQRAALTAPALSLSPDAPPTVSSASPATRPKR